ncbi:VWA domain-containing protein [Kineococcus rhizosphaerae]|uniref:VWA domain containing CoxE-like protein n=1 Tax=Kineococcus rhizosphaerae TaxID=559628 RepID=A0A2T0R4Y0_9ACTN|nr:VWA domain-containing protein [Kineococcus rhizosphaerae]PRY15816.1 VWA domain containing CoxE-like protein [Kineococcus rhizosphaerae]
MTERSRRWRLVLGEAGGEGLGAGADLAGEDRTVDRALGELYDAGSGPRGAGLGGSAPRVARWLGDIRTYFPTSVVQVVQRDAVDRLGLQRLLLEPELLRAVEPDVHLVGTLLSLRDVMPTEVRATARQVVRTVVEEIERRVAQRTRTAVAGALDRANRTRRPRPRDVDLGRTIAANLAHYLPEHRTVVPERLVGYARRQRSVARDVVLLVDQSGSMAESVVHAGVFGAVLASLSTLKTSMVVFDTAVVDLTDQLADPVDVLFGTQLGGGTDINRAIAYGQSLVTRPADTTFVLISDLYEGGVQEEMLRRVGSLVAAGVQVVVLLALSDSGAPAYDAANAAALAELGVPAFACTPDAFPDLLAVALEGGDVGAWAERDLGRPR